MQPQKADEKMKLVTSLVFIPEASMGLISIGNGPQAECVGDTIVATNIADGRRMAKNVMMR